MPNDIIAALITSIIGGLLVAFLNYFSTRKKVEAEIREIQEKTRKISLEADEIRRKQERETLEDSLRKLLIGLFDEGLLDQLASKTAERIIVRLPDVYSYALPTESYFKVNESLSRLVNQLLSNQEQLWSQIQTLLEIKVTQKSLQPPRERK